MDLTIKFLFVPSSKIVVLMLRSSQVAFSKNDNIPYAGAGAVYKCTDYYYYYYYYTSHIQHTTLYYVSPTILSKLAIDIFRHKHVNHKYVSCMLLANKLFS